MGMMRRPEGKRDDSSIRPIRRLAILSVATLAACAMGTGGTSNLLSPLGAVLSPNAATGAPVPLRVDPGAKVIISTAKDLPPASYMSTQADRGEKIYQNTCGTCHGPGT